MTKMKLTFSKLLAVVLLAGCGPGPQTQPTATADGFARQSPGALIANEVMAMSYSGFREGQHPDRGDGAVNPSDAEILEDLNILVEHDFKLIRLYDSGENSVTTL